MHPISMAWRLMELRRLAVRAARNAGANADATDIGQDTIAKLDGEEFNDFGHMEAWVQRVAKNAAHNLRERAKHIEGPFDEELGLEPQSFTSDLVNKQKYRDLIAQLSDKYRSVIELTYYEGLSGQRRRRPARLHHRNRPQDAQRGTQPPPPRHHSHPPATNPEQVAQPQVSGTVSALTHAS